MEDFSAPEKELWTSLQEEAVSEAAGDLKSKLFPVTFETQKPEEKLRSLILSGFIPFSLYGFYLSLWGVNLSSEVSLASYPLLLVAPKKPTWWPSETSKISESRVRSFLG